MRLVTQNVESKMEMGIVRSALLCARLQIVRVSGTIVQDGVAPSQRRGTSVGAPMPQVFGTDVATAVICQCRR